MKKSKTKKLIPRRKLNIFCDSVCDFAGAWHHNITRGINPARKYLFSRHFLRGALVGLLVMLAILMPVRQAHAAIWDGIFNFASESIVKILVVIANALANIGAVLFVFAAHLANYVLGLNYNVYNVDIANPTATSTTNLIVSIGWRIARDITNLGFVLVIVIIALATIIRREEYGVQKLLPKLIAAAILVNFSLTIAGVFVDFSHVLTKFFFDRIALGGSGGIADVLAGAFQPQSLFQTDQEQAISGTSNLETLGNAFLNLVFVIAFTSIGAFTILAFAFMLLLRYLHLSFLGVIAPVVWLFWVVPQLSGQFGKWWSSFLRWTFFAPASAFFMYLALSAVGKFAELNNPSSAVFGTLESSLAGLLAKGANIIVITGMMLGALMIAETMSIKGASGAMALGNKMSGAARAWMGARAAGLRDRTMTVGAGAKITKGRSLLELAAGGLRATPGMGWAGRGLSTWSSNAKARLGKSVDDRIAKGKNDTDDNILSASKASAGGWIDPTGKIPNVEGSSKVAADGILVAQRGLWDKLGKKERERIIDAVRRTGSKDLLLAQRPNLATELELRIDKLGDTTDEVIRPGDGPAVVNEKNERFQARAVGKAMRKLEEASKLLISKMDEKDQEAVAISYTNQHLVQMGNSSSKEDKAAAVEAIKRVARPEIDKLIQIRIDLDKKMEELQDAKDRKKSKGAIDKILTDRDALKSDLETLMTELDKPENKRKKAAVDRWDAISRTSTWHDTVPKPPKSARLTP